MPDESPRAGVRTFVAVPVTAPAVTCALTGAQEQLRRAGAAVKWVTSQQFHFTLRFLGEIPAARVDAARAAAARAAAVTPGPFTLELRGLGAFPRPEGARVLWVGCGDGRAALEELAHSVAAALEAAGFPGESRAFSAHLTLGRVRDGGYRPALAPLLRAGAAQPFGRFAVPAMVLYRSDLGREGPSYTPLGQYPLGGGQQA